MRERLRRLLPVTKKIIAVCALLLTANGSVQAQFNTATQPEYPYPVPGTIIPGAWPNPVNTTTHTYDYTMGHISYMTPYGLSTPTPTPGPPFPQIAPPSSTTSDLLVHSWDDPGSTAGIAWINRATNSGIPGTIYDQGFIMYPRGVQDIEMSIMQDSNGYAMWVYGTTGAWYVTVSYYNSVAGPIGPVGHYVDVYLWNRPAPIGTGGLTLVSRTQLSTVPTFTRISQDGHNSYALCITWEDPTAGINFVYGFMNSTIAGLSLSPVTTLCGTLGQTNPDVTFTHNGNGLKLQFVYYTLAGTSVKITESETPFVLGPPWGPISVCPTVNDGNTLPGPYFSLPNLKTRIDAPDHYGVDNWAYCYIDLMQPNDIFVRFRNFNAPQFGTPVTHNITGSSLTPAPISLRLNDWPTISFDSVSSLLNVGWYTQDPNAASFYSPNNGGYVDVQMDETGALISPVDYMQVATAATLSNQEASFTPGIAYSRQNDRTGFHYIVFANAMGCPSPVSPSQIQTKERPWPIAAFKPSGEQHPLWEDLYANNSPANVNQAPAQKGDYVKAYPNPFNSKLGLDISSSLIDKVLDMQITDITGREIDRYSGTGSSINTHLSALSPKLANGSYIINIATQSDDFRQTIKVQKLQQ